MRIENANYAKASTVLGKAELLNRFVAFDRS